MKQKIALKVRWPDFPAPYSGQLINVEEGVKEDH
jgi:hypothetical protein